MAASLSRQPVGGMATMSRRLAVAVDPMTAIVSATAGTVAVALASGAAIVLFRRVSGGFASVPAASLAWGIAAAGMAIVAVIDAVVHAGGVGRWAGTITRLGVVLSVAAMIPLGLPVGSLIAGMVALGLVTTAALLPLRDTCRRDENTTRDHAPLGRMRSVLPPAGLTEWQGGPGAVPLMPGGLRQRLERFQSTDGVDHVVGRVLVDVAAGSRTGHGHIGFCPPFAATPTVEVTSEDDGIEAVVSAAEVVPWGVRVECRLSEPAEESLAIPVHVIARYPF